MKINVNIGEVLKSEPAKKFAAGVLKLLADIIEGKDGKK